MTVVELVARSADQHPERTAVSWEHGSLSYRELNDRANRLANTLSERGLTHGAPVGVYTHRGADMIVALLGILKAGGACVPLDPQYPDERIRFMIDDARPSMLVTHGDLDDRLGGVPVRRLVLDRQAGEIGRASAADPAVAPPPTQLAYVLYTSGSTGVPKGVEIEHHALRDNAIKTARLHDLSADDVMLQFASLSFASSMGQIFAPLSVGAEVVVRGRQYSAAGLLDYVRARDVTVLWLTPSMINYLVRHAETSSVALAIPRLRLLRSGGEALTTSLARRWFALSDVPLLNVYGPTEAVQDVTACLLGEPPLVATIGRPIFDVEVFVLDDSREPVEPGTPGELYFSTPGMARGYLNQPGLTSERFVDVVISGRALRLYRTGDLVRMLDSGELEYLGRRDRQVKVQGHRIELGEIEERLTRHPAITAAVVVLSPSASGEARLVAYCMWSGGPGVREPDLMRWCATALPAAMVPTRFVGVDTLPLTVNGKLDRRTLDSADSGP
ncbi:amino acid adenylation domain-containing protein [Micromonospora sagamiensis]|uniref:Amino acid adenylation domain-containing protein n=1 Tax=Micromonospora sagamiensis TaxID=47875 RepID=A0A562WJ27_9ACTN|nr:amino acid adenylation domain-containing protein [Micromonospora sagamiensis]TWJ30300.1 amino acid adenylation domain-containing protein [Micromonospora sagamiensis]BCL16670.1 hypothetical protein GCM10017556_44090 [Micromonospora sagamiensis]